MPPWIFISPSVLFDWLLIKLKKTGMYVCNADLTQRRARISIAASQMREIWNILSVLVCFCPSYPALRAHAPYCRLWPYHICPHYLMNGTIFVNSLQLLYETVLVLRRIHRDIIINIHWSSSKVPCYSCQIVIQFDFQTILKHKISWKSVPWEPSCSVRTDMTKLILAFRNFCAHSLEAYKGRGGIAALILNLPTTLT